MYLSKIRPDGNFPTVKSPNPEEPGALKMAIEKAVETGADLVMATDPDADRLGIACKNKKGEFILLNGNQTCVLLAYYIISQYKELKKIKGNEYIIKTIVTTDLLDRIAEKNKVELLQCSYRLQILCRADTETGREKELYRRW